MNELNKFDGMNQNTTVDEKNFQETVESRDDFDSDTDESESTDFPYDGRDKERDEDSAEDREKDNNEIDPLQEEIKDREKHPSNSQGENFLSPEQLEEIFFRIRSGEGPEFDFTLPDYAFAGEDYTRTGISDSINGPGGTSGTNPGIDLRNTPAYLEAFARNKKKLETFCDEETIKKIALVEAAEKIEKEYSRDAVRDKLTREMVMKFDPRAQIARDIISEIPAVKQAFDTGDPFAMLLAIAGIYLQKSYEQCRNTIETHSRQNKAKGGNGGRSSSLGKANKEVLPDRIMRNLRGFSNEAIQAFIRASRE